MPNYPGAASSKTSAPSNISPLALSTPGDSAYLFGTLSTGATQLPITDSTVTGESPAAGTASIAITLPARDGSAVPMVSFEGFFSGAPGTFEIDIQEADTDADALYILPSAAAYTVSAVNATTQAFRVDLNPTGGRFMRVLLKTRTNAVSLVVKATRLA